MTESKKCAHPLCHCQISEGKEFCSDYCASIGASEEAVCGCGHPACTESGKL